VDNHFNRLAVLIPAFNAERTLGQLLANVAQQVPVSNILVVDDGSTDSTASVARHHSVIVIQHKVNQGKGAALNTGFRELANNTGIDALVTLDADLQHRPEDIASFVHMQERSGAEIVVGNRNRVGTSMPVHRRISNTITSFLVSARTGKAIPDSQCGFRLLTKEAYASIRTESSGFGAETEFLIKAARRGFRIESVPIGTIYDNEGSHMRNWETTVSFIRVLFKDYT
jgi:glycosyltransferase involved in cell wall biosynthesis